MGHQFKKAQLNRLQAIILALIVIGVILFLAFEILEEAGETVDFSNTSLITNESMNVSDNGTRNAVSHSNRRGFQDMVIVNSSNTTGIVLIPANNYTYDADEGTIQAIKCETNVDVGCENASTWYVTYNYTYLTGYSEAFKGANITISAVKKIPAWLGLIVIISIIGIVLSIIFNVLPRLPETARTPKGEGIRGRFEDRGISRGGGGAETTTAEL